MAILRRLLIASIFALLASACVHAQSTTVIDGSQTNLVIVGQGNSINGFVAWRAKFIPSHIIFAFELPAGYNALNPIVKCSLDDQAMSNPNPNDGSRWQQVAISALNSPIGGTAFDAAGPSVGTVGTPAVVLVETGVFPCVDWAIEPGSPVFGGLSNSKVTAVQLPASGDSSFLGTTVAGIITSGGPRPVSPGAVVPVSTSPITVGGSTLHAFSQDPGNNLFAAPLTGILGYPDGQPHSTQVATGENNNTVSAFPTHATIRYAGNQSPTGTANAWDRNFYCPKVASTSALGAAAAQLVAGVASQKIRICSVTISNTNATGTTIAFVEGTGLNCVTGQTTLIPAITVGPNTAANSTVTIYLGSDGAWITNVAADEFCAVGSAAGSVNIAATFAQYQ